MVRRDPDNTLPEHIVLTIVVTLTEPSALRPTSNSAVAEMMSRDVLPTATPQMLGDDCPMSEVAPVYANTSNVVVRSLAGIGAATLGVLIIVMVAFVFWRYHRIRASILRRPCKSDSMSPSEPRSRRSSPSLSPTPVTPYLYDCTSVSEFPGREIPGSWFYHDHDHDHDRERPPSYTTELPVPVLLTPIPARQKRASVIVQNARRSTLTPIDLDAEFAQQGYAY
ncbi:hypothetical protein TRAPUB_5914 [Trametes pubescens]|uniref:Uncharacterized protein n=1 Tax=Trametes pubescens TaxID=154538 RepID=A0A1M2V799_TRAPU|nr:hypothetical protein TRAPUB_5914 [Trametes pubescens]